jgi:thiol-disulfide isomerase/thioredoxin
MMRVLFVLALAGLLAPTHAQPPEEERKAAGPPPSGVQVLPAGPDKDLGTVVADVELIGPDRKGVKLSQFRGKVVVLDIGGLTCSPCLEVLPELDKLAKDYGGKGVVVLPVFEGATWGELQKWVGTKNNTDLKFYLDPAQGSDEINTRGVRARLNRLGGIPMTYVIGPDRRLLLRHEGYDGGKEKGLLYLRKAIDAALANRPPEGERK